MYIILFVLNHEIYPITTKRTTIAVIKLPRFAGDKKPKTAKTILLRLLIMKNFNLYLK